jgi:hypothetical protein
MSNQAELDKSTTIESKSEYIERLEKKVELLKEYKKDNEKMVKYIKLLEKDLGIGVNQDLQQQKPQIQVYKESRPKYRSLTDNSYVQHTHENTCEYYPADPLVTQNANHHFSTIDSSYPSVYSQPLHPIQPSQPKRRYHQHRSSSQIFPNHIKSSLQFSNLSQKGRKLGKIFRRPFESLGRK